VSNRTDTERLEWLWLSSGTEILVNGVTVWFSDWKADLRTAIDAVMDKETLSSIQPVPPEAQREFEEGYAKTFADLQTKSRRRTP
jgi:hypothetical protein